jgi:hypothetical protein
MNWWMQEAAVVEIYRGAHVFRVSFLGCMNGAGRPVGLLGCRADWVKIWRDIRTYNVQCGSIWASPQLAAKLKTGASGLDLTSTIPVRCYG